MENSLPKWNLLHGSSSMLPQNDLTDPARVTGNRDRL